MNQRVRLAAIGAACLIVAAGLLVVLSMPIGGQPSASVLLVGSSPLHRQARPGHRAADLDGNTVRLADLRGKPVVLNFWASWCIPCRDEFPQFVAARGEHAAQDLQLVGVVHNDAADSARAFAAAQGALWPMLHGPSQRGLERVRRLGWAYP